MTKEAAGCGLFELRCDAGSKQLKYASSPKNLPCKYSTCEGVEQESAQLEAQARKPYWLMAPEKEEQPEAGCTLNM